MVKTIIIRNVITKECADTLFEVLRDNIEWEEGIKSKKGFTRLAKAIDITEYPDLESVIINVIKIFSENSKNTGNYIMSGVYLNYYMDGKMFTPNHTHKGMHQLVISLGVTRNFIIRKKIEQMNSGDAIMFGSAVHGVPVQPEIKDGRISIAVFLIPIV
jgi:hypothetical protein